MAAFWKSGGQNINICFREPQKEWFVENMPFHVFCAKKVVYWPWLLESARTRPPEKSWPRHLMCKIAHTGK